jgi:hypothetical protein
VRNPPFFILESIKDAERPRPDLKSESSGFTHLCPYQWSGQAEKLLDVRLFAWTCLQLRQDSYLVHLISPYAAMQPG